MTDIERMQDLKGWHEVEKGLYRYIIAAGACYEIVIWHLDSKVDPMNSYKLNTKASVYITGDWISKDGSYFSREPLLENDSVVRCIQAAIKDYTENCQ